MLDYEDTGSEEHQVSIVRIPTSQIRAGDVVLEHGMRVRIDFIREYEGGLDGSGVPGMTVYGCHGTVLNLAEVRAARIVPMSFLTTDKWVEGQGWTTDRRDAWTVQGNDLATWTVDKGVFAALDKVQLSWMITLLSGAQADMGQAYGPQRETPAVYIDLANLKGDACAAWKLAPEGEVRDCDEADMREITSR